MLFGGVAAWPRPRLQGAKNGRGDPVFSTARAVAAVRDRVPPKLGLSEGPDARGLQACLPKPPTRLGIIGLRVRPCRAGAVEVLAADVFHIRGRGEVKLGRYANVDGALGCPTPSRTIFVSSSEPGCRALTVASFGSNR